MVLHFKRTAARGFTLIELLIVVIILAIIAAIAIPQFTNNTDDARVAALDSNLAAVRAALEQYRIQHTGNVYPGAVAATGATCTVGAAVTPAAAGSKEAMDAQLTGYSNAAGQVCTGPTPGYTFGPYLRQGLPADPITGTRTVVVTSAGAPLAPAAATGGWAYDTMTGQFVVNSNAPETTGSARTLSQH
jgi:general secretion pathway protein G